MLHRRRCARGVRRTHRAGSYTFNSRFGPLALLCLVLASCGGGSGAASSGSYSGASLYVSPSSVSLSSTTSQTSEPTATLQVDIYTVSASTQTYTSVSYSTYGINSVTQTVSASAYTLTINFLPPSQLGAGTYDDTVKVSTCYDQKCAHEVSGSPEVIPVTYTVAQAGPSITGVQPSSADAGGPAFTLSVSGTGFTSQSIVDWNGSPLPTAFVSSTALTAQVSAADINIPDIENITVISGSSRIPTSNIIYYTVSGPTLTSISPTSASLGAPAFTLSVAGANFTTNSIIEWNGTPLTTTFVTSDQLTAQVPATDLSTAESVPVSVAISATNSGGPPPIDFAVIAPTALTLVSVSPPTVYAGGPPFSLTILGYGFDSASVAQWNGSALSTKYVSAQELLAQNPATDIASAGSAAVTVQNASQGVTSSVSTVTIAPPLKDAVALQMNPAHSGAVEFNSVSLPSTSSWAVNVGGTPSYALIADGKVFVTVQMASGSNPSSELLALDQKTGATAWGPISVSGQANATYDGGTVFVVSAPITGAADLLAYDAATGVQEWSTLLTGQYFFSSGPTAADGYVFTGGAGSGGTLYAVEEGSGAIAWTAPVMNGDDSTPAVTADGLYVTYPCQVYDFRPATGETIWSENSGCEGGGGATPVEANGVLYAPSVSTGVDGSVLNAETGANEGTYAADVLPAFTATTGYFLQSGTLRAISVPSGTILWSFTGDGQLASSPIVVNQYVFIGSSSGNLYALDASSGALLWQQNLGAAIPASPGMDGGLPQSGLAAGDGLLVVPAGDTVTAYTLSTNP